MFRPRVLTLDPCRRLLFAACFCVAVATAAPLSLSAETAPVAADAAISPLSGEIGLSVLTLNLHTYQELETEGVAEANLTADLAKNRIESYGPVFERIAAGIRELDPDVICLQEVGEWAGPERNDPDELEFGASASNMVHQILARLGDTRYFYTMDWSHYGWDVWLEGSAILSRYPLLSSDSRFISSPATNRYENWKSRNVPMADIDVPGIGRVAVFSVHAGWWDDPDEPFQGQFQRLLAWIGEFTEPAPTIILCGDFNVPAGGPGYAMMTGESGYSDQYLLANPDGMHDATIGGGIDGWEDSDVGQRIDYILMNDTSPLVVERARRLFTEADFGRVSDHVGVYAEFALRKSR